MKWLNFDLEELRKPEFVGADSDQKGVWLSVISWCAAVENGGKIIAARCWSAQMWQKTCGVSLKAMLKPSNLWSWEGENLVIWNYPLGKETQVKAGRSGGNEGGRPKKPNPTDNPSVNPTDNPKGRERKGIGMEGEGNGRGAPPAVEFPVGFPATGEQAVSWVRSAMLAPTAPDEAITETWAKIVGQGFRSGSGQKVENWAMWFHSLWLRIGGGWMEERARRATGGGEKKETPGDGPRFKTPKWPWRLVARRALEWVYAPEMEWRDIDLDDRRAMKSAWDSLTPEQQAEFLEEAREVVPA